MKLYILSTIHVKFKNKTRTSFLEFQNNLSGNSRHISLIGASLSNFRLLISVLESYAGYQFENFPLLIFFPGKTLQICFRKGFFYQVLASSLIQSPSGEGLVPNMLNRNSYLSSRDNTYIK